MVTGIIMGVSAALSIADKVVFGRPKPGSHIRTEARRMKRRSGGLATIAAALGAVLSHAAMVYWPEAFTFMTAVCDTVGASDGP